MVHTLCLAEKVTRKRTKFNRKNTASSSKQLLILFPRVPGIFSFKNQPTKKNKNTVGGGNWRSYYRCTVVPGIRITFKDALDNHEQTGGGAGCKRPRQRGTDASFTCVLLRSRRDVRRPWRLPNVKTAAIFQPHPDGTMKKQTSYFGDTQTAEVY